VGPESTVPAVPSSLRFGSSPETYSILVALDPSFQMRQKVNMQ
jgi:hypothetical protein